MIEKEIFQIQDLLNQVDVIRKKYDQIAEITGERFNIFSILDLQDSETRLHSKLINELLNPKGKHGQKDLFLKKFIEVVNSKIKDEIVIDNSKNVSSQKIRNFETESAISEIEKHIGFKNEDATEGGRIDIIISDSKKHGIIIENKIWAGDQEKQLLRYHKYGVKNFDKFHLLYLTIDGKEPSEWSTDNKIYKNEYICLSYNEDIINRLELCRKECTQLPIIRETLTQYINQIKNYSGQSINHIENMEIGEILSKDEKNIENAFKIAHSINLIRPIVFKEFANKLQILAKSRDLELNQDTSNFANAEFGLNLYNSKWKSYQIRLEFSSSWLRDFCIGICRKNNDLSKDDNSFNQIKELFNGNQNSESWPYWIYFEDEYRYWWDNPIPWIDIRNNKLILNIDSKLNLILNKIKHSDVF